MSELNVPGIASELSLRIADYVGPLRAALAETRTLGTQLDAGLATSGARATSSLAGLGGSVSTLASQARPATNLTRDMGAAIDVAAASARRAADGVGGMGQGLRSLAGVVGTLNPQAGQLVSLFTAMDGAAKATGGSFVAASLGIGGLVAGLAGARAAFGFATDGVGLAADMEQTSIAFEVMIGNAQLARETLGDLKSFADKTPFAFPEIAGAAKQLLAMQIPAADLVGTLRRLGDVSSGLGQPLGEMAYLLGQIRTQTNATREDLNQFAGRGVPIYSALAKVLGTTEGGVKDLATAGRIGFAEVKAAIDQMTDAGGKFYGMTERQAASLKGQLTTLEDAWATLKRSTGEAFIGPASGAVLTDLTQKFADLTPAAQRFGVALRDALMRGAPGRGEVDRPCGHADGPRHRQPGGEGAGRLGEPVDRPRHRGPR